MPCPAGEPVAQAGREGLAADQALRCWMSLPPSGGLFHRMRRKLAVPSSHRPQFGNGLQLLLGLAGAGREHGAAQRMRAGLHDEAPGVMW